MSTNHPQHVREALEVAHRELYYNGYIGTDDNYASRVVLALAEKGLLLTPLDKACVEACREANKTAPGENITHAPALGRWYACCEAGQKWEASRKKPERWTVALGSTTATVFLDGALSCMFYGDNRVADARAYAAQRNAEEATK